MHNRVMQPGKAANQKECKKKHQNAQTRAERSRNTLSDLYKKQLLKKRFQKDSMRLFYSMGCWHDELRGDLKMAVCTQWSSL